MPYRVVFWLCVGLAAAWAYPRALRSLGTCPPLLRPLPLALLRVGENRSSARPVVLPLSALPWRPTFAEELLGALGGEAGGEGARAWDDHGRPLRCAADAAAGGAVYAAAEGVPWQWSPERVGHERDVWVSAALDEAFTSGPPGDREAETERQERVAPRPASHRVALQTLSASPPIFRARGLLPPSLLDELALRAAERLARSTVGDGSLADGAPRVDQARTSRSAWLHGYNDQRVTLPAARAAQRAVVELLRQPSSVLARGVEPALVVEYGDGEYYEPHLDAFASSRADSAVAEARSAAYQPPRGSNRFASVLVYLTDGEGEGGGAGGHTVFPLAAPSNASAYFDGVSFLHGEGGRVDAGTSECEFPDLLQQRGLMVRPKRGDAVVFYSQTPDGALDARVLHGSCPVRRGRKAAANVWVWNRAAIYSGGRR